MFACYSGLRRPEIVRLRWKDIDLKAGTFRAVKMKGRGERRTHIEHVQTMPQALAEFIADWLAKLPADQQAIFCPNDDHLKGHGFDEMAVSVKADALIELLKGTDFNFCGFHIFRHSFASRLVELGATPEEGAAIIGHATTVMFQHYAHRSRQQRDQILSGFGNPVGRNQDRT